MACTAPQLGATSDTARTSRHPCHGRPQECLATTEDPAAPENPLFGHPSLAGSYGSASGASGSGYGGGRGRGRGNWGGGGRGRGKRARFFR